MHFYSRPDNAFREFVCHESLLSQRIQRAHKLIHNIRKGAI